MCVYSLSIFFEKNLPNRLHLMEYNSSSRRTASVFAIVAAILFAIMIPMFKMAAGNSNIAVVVAILAVAFHVLLFPVVAQLRAPEWARAAGYAWLAIDTTLNIMSLNGADAHAVTQVRLGAHIMAALWAGNASLHRETIVKVVGIAFAIAIAG